MKPTVISASLGLYDVPQPVAPQSIDCDFVMYADQIHPSWQRTGWDIRQAPISQHPRLDAKVFKMMPWCSVPQGPWIWIDARMEVVSPTFVEELLDVEGPIAQWEHPARHCGMREAWFSASLPKYRGQPLIEQAQAYAADGHPEDWGLWAAGLIVYRKRLNDFGVDWYDECAKWTVQDQVSEPYVLRNHNLRPTSLPHHLLDNPWVALHPHQDGTS